MHEQKRLAGFLGLGFNVDGVPAAVPGSANTLAVGAGHANGLDIEHELNRVAEISALYADCWHSNWSAVKALLLPRSPLYYWTGYAQ